MSIYKKIITLFLFIFIYLFLNINFSQNIFLSEILEIDKSKTDLGIINVKLLDNLSETKYKISIELNDNKYYYDILKNKTNSFPLQLGNGTYILKVYKRKRKRLYSESFSL